MDSFAHAVGWAAHFIDVVWALWFGIGLVVGGIALAHDEWRWHRTKPKLHEVRAYADDLVARHGRDAFRVNGDAMVAARDVEAFGRHRFLQEVAGELAARLALEPCMSLGRVGDGWRPRVVREPRPADAIHRRVRGRRGA